MTRKQELADLIDEVAADAEAVKDLPDDGSPLPAHVKTSRPNQIRGRVLQVRLNDDELEALERIAERKGVPVSTLARGHLMQLIELDWAERDETGGAVPD